MSSGPKAQYDTQHAPPRRLQQQQQPQPHASTSAAATINAQAGAQAQGYAQAQPPQQQPAAIVAKGNRTKDLVQLAKTAETQLHTAHILSAHASLTQKDRAVEDIREQRNRLESERARLIECLAQVNEDRNQADLLEATLDRERALLRAKIAQLSEGEYRAAKFPHRAHAGVQPAAPDMCPASGCSMPTLATLVHCASRSAPHTRSPAPQPLGPAAPPNCLQVRAMNPPRCASRLACPGTRRIRAALGR
ncbi:hypothetical protein B0H14DRAFT_3130657 [Mycena olivaceomarginata]|nr:hypothetical protein B0H14DRAFT_3130657 [Mycena olivaceomarginata]